MMRGFFYIDISNKLIRVRYKVTHFDRNSPRTKWLCEALGISRPLRFYNPTRKEWEFKLSKKLVRRLLELDFDTEPWTYNYIYGPLNKNYYKIELPKDVPYLRLFQRHSVQFFIEKEHRALLALPPGTGKTIIAIGAYEACSFKKMLVVCPSTVKEQWRNRFTEFTGITEAEVLYGIDSLQKIPDDIKLVVLNYDILARNVIKEKKTKRYSYKYTQAFEEFMSSNFDFLVFDECHYLKDVTAKSKVYKASKKIAGVIPHIMALSGTPMENTPAELFNILEILKPTIYRNRMHFYERYCNPEKTGFGVKYRGVSFAHELHRMLIDTVMFRRKKAQILRDMPGVQGSVIPFKVDLKEYYSYMDEIKKDSDLSNKLSAGNYFEKALQKAYELKREPSIEFIKEELEKKQKIVVFCWHKKTIKDLMDEFGDMAVKIDGSTPSHKREDIKNEFITNQDKRLFIGNIISAGTGLDGLQTVADTVIFMELTWKHTKVDQAIDRLSRIGFWKDTIFVYYLVAMGTREETLAELIDSKRRVFNKVVDGSGTEEIDLLEKLIEEERRHV